MTSSLGIIATVAMGLPVTAEACVRAPLQVLDDATPITVMIDPTCLSDPTDTGVILADLVIQLTEAHLVSDDSADFISTREVLVETFVSEILEPTLSAN